MTVNVLLWSYGSDLTDEKNTHKNRLPTSLEFRNLTYQGSKRKLSVNSKPTLNEPYDLIRVFKFV